MTHVDIDTKMITLIGDPLAQSYAADMQNHAYEVAGINLVYFYTVAGNEHLEDIVNGIRHMPFAGFASTKPNKVEILKYLDELDPLCEKMGASNTIVKTEEGKLIGYNTDGIGFITSLKEEAAVTVEDHEYFCIGAGGAGRAICSNLAYFGAKKIYIMDQIAESARELVNDINENFAPVAEHVAFGDFSNVASAGVVINATGIGMGDSIGETPMPAEAIPENDQLYFDACYNPEKTQFLLNAEAAGKRILNGLGMSLYQGAAQIELWTGKPAPVEEMRAKLLEITRQ